MKKIIKLIFILSLMLNILKADFVNNLLHDAYYGYNNTSFDKDDITLLSIKVKAPKDIINSSLTFYFDIPNESDLNFFIEADVSYNIIETSLFEIYPLINFSLIYYNNDEDSSEYYLNGLGFGIGTELYITSRINLILDYKIDYLTDNYLGSSKMERLGFHIRFSK